MTPSPAGEPSSEPLRRYTALARAVPGALKLDEALQQVAVAMAAVRPGVLAVIRLVDRTAGSYRVPPAPEGLIPVVSFGAGVTHAVAQGRQPLDVRDLRTDPRPADPA